MSNIALEIFKLITSNSVYNYYEIIIDEPANNVNVILSNMDNSDGTKIAIGSIDVKQLLNGSLPDKLEKLTIKRGNSGSSGSSGCSGCTKMSLVSNLPSKLKKLKLVSVGSKLSDLPLELEILELEGDCSKCCLDYLPSSIKTLVIQSKMSICLDNLPSTLENLFLLFEYTRDLKNLPSELKFLHLDCLTKINVILPKKIECVILPKNNLLKKILLKTYPKVSYNDFNYTKLIERYDTDDYYDSEYNYSDYYDSDNSDDSDDSDNSDDSDFDEYNF